MVPAATPTPTPELLCENCGYAIADIDLDSSCPECGLAIASSLPAARTGLWFQNHRPPRRGWRTTVADIILTPRRSFRHMRIDAGGSRRFLVISLTVNALLWSAGLVGTWAMNNLAFAKPATYGAKSGAEVFLFGAAPAFALIALAVFALTLVLTRVEGLGVRIATRRRGWRITRDISRTVCAYASCGWILGGAVYTVELAVLFLWCTAQSIDQFVQLHPEPFWIALTVAAIAGMLAFETLVYLGIRQCRYANAPAPPLHNPRSDHPHQTTG